MVAVPWTLVAAVPVIAVLAVVLGRSRWRRNRLAARFPGPTLWLPGFGNIIDAMLRYGLAGVEWLYGFDERFGRVYRIWVGSDLLISTADPDDIEAVVTDPTLIDKALNYSLLRPWLGDGLLLLGGRKWHARRKLLTPAFHFRILDQFMDVFNEKGAILESKLLAVAESDDSTVDIRPFISRQALDVICETAMGTSINAQIGEDSGYVQAVKTACAVTDERNIKPWLANDLLFRLSPSGRSFYSALEVLHGVTRRVIDSRKAELQGALERKLERKLEASKDQDQDHGDGAKRRMVFIDQLLDMHLRGEDLSDKDIFDEVNTFMFEGHDTTTTSMCFTLYALATHPEVQDRLVAEVREVAGDDSLTAAHLAELKYMDAVIKESLRLYPSVPLFFRHCDREYRLASGHLVPAHSTIMINVFMAHRDAKHFKNPLEFDPDRFLSDASRHHFTYIPFSAGFRNCIGQRFATMSMKATLARLLRSFRFLPAPGATLDLDVAVVLTTKTGVRLKLQRRT